MNTSPQPVVPPLAQRLSYAGLLPFIGLAASLWFVGPLWKLVMGNALLAYGALIATFLGGIHWGIAQRDAAQPVSGLYLWGVVPSLVGWCAMVLPVPVGLLMVSGLLLTCYGVDRNVYPRHGLAHWLPLRLQLSVVAALSCLVGAYALRLH